jgi:hypothetical protein
MIKLKTVVQQLTEEHYKGMVSQFQKSRGEKFSSLLKYLRESTADEEEVPEQLALNKTSYYTLKSRLYEKIQEFLFENVQDLRIELLSNVANIHTLIYNTPKDTAIAILKKLEKELADCDMPNELISVYNALKKLHLSSPKYYEYAQLYNKHVAYTIALDKVEDLLSRFVKALGEFLISRDPEMVEILTLMKAEMSNVFRLYESHHLAIYRNILNISFALYIPDYQPSEEEMSVEEMLNASWKIFDENVRDAHYKFLRSVFDFLAFEYYHGLKLYKNEAPYFEKINIRLDAFMLADHCCFNARFLISKVERYSYLGITGKLEAESNDMITEVKKEDAAGYVYWKMFKACAFYYSNKYSEAAKCLNEALNDVGFKNMLFAEVEVKLFLALNYSMLNKYELVETLIKSISRKMNDREGENYENVHSFIRILKLQIGTTPKELEDKIKKLRDKFVIQNEGRNKVLSFLKMDDAFIAELSKSIKRKNA